MKILLAVDGSSYTKHMLAFLAARPELLGGDRTHTALTVVPALPPHVARFLPQGVETTYYDEQAQAVLRPVQAFAAQQGWSLEARHVVGTPGDAIAEEASAGKYDLLVLGSHGHGALGSMVLGSVASRVIAQCKTPVLLIRQ
jgi:nucleotide-binding universal stress UspA family protein